jgi:hypothetical protein
MPKVIEKKKNRGGTKTYTCTKCGKVIEPGQMFREWSFRYGGTYRMHSMCGYPRQSQLTQSRMSDVYAAIESAEDIAAGEPGTWTKDDIVTALEEAISTAEEIRDEKQSAADEHFGGGGPLAEQAEEMETVVGEIEQARDTVQDIDEPDDECEACGGSGERATALSANGSELERHERSGTKCDVCGGSGKKPTDEDEDDPWYEQVRSAVSEISV